MLNARIAPVWLVACPPAYRPLEKIFSMFGSNDDKKAPAEAGEKKGLFGWFRKKPQSPAAEPPPAEPLEDSQPFADYSADTDSVRPSQLWYHSRGVKLGIA